MEWVYVALGGALGSVLRYGGALFAARAFGTGWPWGTFAVNVIGSFAMGLAFVLIVERMGAGRAALLIMTGVLGGFTTFSAFSLDAFSLWETARHSAAVIYVCATVVVSIAALFAGAGIARMAFA